MQQEHLHQQTAIIAHVITKRDKAAVTHPPCIAVKLASEEEACHSRWKLLNVDDLCRVTLHNGQLPGVALALVLRVLALQHSCLY